jgi:putative addiction module CopG family antidote
VPIPAELESFVQGVVENGTYRSPAEVVGEALRLLARREKLLRDVKAGVDQLDRGEYSEYGADSEETFLADIATEEQSRFPPKNRA